MAAPRLHELQGAFFDALTNPDGPSAGFFAMVDDGPSASRIERIGVYTNAYFGRLREILVEDFPQIAATLGADTFQAIVRDYLRAYPSEHPSVRYLGKAMAAFIAKRAELPPWASDLALLEWTRVEMFDAVDTEAASLKQLEVRSDQWADLVIRPIAAMRVISCEWPVHELWAGRWFELGAPRKTALRVWRAPDYSVRHRAMDPLEATALAIMGRGALFDAVCEVFSHVPEAQAAQNAAGLLARWLADGIIAKFA